MCSIQKQKHKEKNRMFNILNINSVREKVRNSSTYIAVAVLMLASFAPLVLQSNVSAQTLTTRSATINKSAPSSTNVEFAFAYSIPNTTSTKAGIIYQFCTTPLGACTLPTGMNVQTSNTHDSQTGWPTNGTAFAAVSEAANVGECTLNTNTYMICYSRDETVATGTTGGAVTHTISGITAPSSAQTVYVRIALYTNDDFLNANRLQSGSPATDDAGTIAVAFVNQLNVTGRVQERLVFCVFALDDLAGSSATVGAAAGNFPTNCSAAEATASSSVDIGVVDNLNIARSPVDNAPPTSLGNDRFGAAMINTNASNGISLTYYATAATSGTNELRSFRVGGATCDVSGTSVVDQCFISANNTSGETLAAGTERFGMQIVCITNSNTTTAGSTANLGTGGNGTGSSGGTFNTVYANGDTTQAQLQDTGSDDCENSEAGNLVAWRDSATAQALIHSSTVVDDELVKMRFAATANATTPTGTYTVATTYIATPVF